jgi:hypothetical protein
MFKPSKDAVALGQCLYNDRAGRTQFKNLPVHRQDYFTTKAERLIDQMSLLFDRRFADADLLDHATLYHTEVPPTDPNQTTANRMLRVFLLVWSAGISIALIMGLLSWLFS